MRFLKSAGIFLSVFSLLFASQDVLACAVCTSNDEVSSAAYLRSTILMSLVPLAALGGMAYLIYWNMKRGKAKE